MPRIFIARILKRPVAVFRRQRAAVDAEPAPIGTSLYRICILQINYVTPVESLALLLQKFRGLSAPIVEAGIEENVVVSCDYNLDGMWLR